MSTSLNWRGITGKIIDGFMANLNYLRINHTIVAILLFCVCLSSIIAQTRGRFKLMNQNISSLTEFASVFSFSYVEAHMSIEWKLTRPVAKRYWASISAVVSNVRQNR